MNAVLDWWLSLWPDHGLIGPVIACVVAAFVVLAVGNAIIWPIAWIKAAIVGWSEDRADARAGVAALQEWEADDRRSVPLDQLQAEHPHEELRVVDERPVDHR